MGKRTEEQTRLLNGLVMDCITYGLSEAGALKYIETRFGEKISAGAYYERKKKLESDETATEWLNHHTRVGFVLAQKRHIEDIERIRDWAMERFFIESNQEDAKMDKEYILKLNNDIRETTKLLNEFNIGNPIIAQMHADNEKYKRKYKELLARSNIPHTVTN